MYRFAANVFNMKYSQLAGIIITLVLIGACFLPWSYIASENWLITGMNTMGTHYGKPGIIHITLGILAIICYTVPRLWSKRANLFICATNIAWMVRNFLLLSTCVAGECSDKKYGLYIVITASLLMFVTACLPKIPVKENKFS